MKKLILAAAVLFMLAVAPADATEPISGAAFTLDGPVPSGCTFDGSKATGTQGYPVLALSDNECGCVESWFHDTSAVNWQVTPVISVPVTEGTNNNGCLDVYVAVYVQGADLTTLGTPTVTTIEDTNVSTTANDAEYMDTSGNIAVYNVDADGACTKPTCDAKLARICLWRATDGLCASNNYPNDLYIEVLNVNKAP